MGQTLTLLSFAVQETKYQELEQPSYRPQALIYILFNSKPFALSCFSLSGLFLNVMFWKNCWFMIWNQCTKFFSLPHGKNYKIILLKVSFPPGVGNPLKLVLTKSWSCPLSDLSEYRQPGPGYGPVTLEACTEHYPLSSLTRSGSLGHLLWLNRDSLGWPFSRVPGREQFLEKQNRG